ncbi:MAG: MBL fold metallo-hydrolase, partial [Deltaproteobacteria bacterium]|nr:MBL fold metallo-hydrolase [Deltaproteobacteria bacterium]
HLHPDHFDRAAMSALTPPPKRVILPPDALRVLGEAAKEGWQELAPWKSTSVGSVRVHAVPGPHTLPGPEEVNFVLDFPGWGRVFFGGDARLDQDVAHKIADRFGPFGLALLPVGGTRILGRRTVMSPKDAVTAADILGAAKVIPIHEGGIWMSVPPLSLHPGRARHLESAFQKRGEGHRVLLLSEGAGVVLSKAADKD